ncbi:hypothetical protein [Dyadobacter sp. CY261]|uniref:hypothetical protein n=1 Tax=Dyadobacter sp. CY261 TaxID=2907203 RepID=UPI001F487647|nr:hypothetical protein [Dyadobacter sp. CY261]
MQAYLRRRIAEDPIKLCNGLVNLPLRDTTVFHQKYLSLLCAGSLHFPVLRVIDPDRRSEIFFFGFPNQDLAICVALRIVVEKVTFNDDLDLSPTFQLENFLVNHDFFKVLRIDEYAGLLTKFPASLNFYTSSAFKTFANFAADQDISAN